MPTLLSSALWYASQGIPVFPLRPGRKQPLPGSHGFKDATCSPDQIRAWWQARPDANIGAATGHKFDVIDADTKDALNDALELTGIHGLWIVGIVETPRGWHVWVPPTGAGNTTRIGGKPVDYRGLGGYVLLPPSNVNGHPYRWDCKPEFVPGYVQGILVDPAMTRKATA